MKYQYDIITIGLGPAGMAVAVMASEMGLKVAAIEKNKVGGECMNVGCIPSKALLQIARYRAAFEKLPELELAATAKPEILKPFQKIAAHLDYISEKKTMGMFKKVQMIYQQGPASFVDSHTIKVADKTYTANKIFIAAGTRPDVPAFPGIETIDYLTNENMFKLEKIPASMIITGGGAIACEMAQAFARLGCEVTMIIRGPRLMWRQDSEATDLIEKTFAKEGITILRQQNPIKFEKQNNMVIMHTDAGQTITAEKLLLAAGRKMDYTAMALDKAGVKVNDKGAIIVDKYLRTTAKNIFAIGDCNGYAQFSHAAMHQGMIAVMNSMLPGMLKRKYQAYIVPWTVFTEPEFSHSGLTASELQKRNIKYETIQVNYSDYGAAIAEAIDQGFIKAYVSPGGRIYGVDIIGHNSGEMINQWSLAIQKKLRLSDIMLLQHSFPTMGFLSKRIAEVWMMNKMKSEKLKQICRFMFRL
jgi:pyruvate/2-oxoglutarate dehydrogenase complex dihydrolipoamide dehydrogenase (E3) component